MKNFNELFESKSKSGLSVNSMLFNILGSGKKLSRFELKVEMFKLRFKEKFGIEFDNKFFDDVKYKDDIVKLSVVSRNSIDTIISKNNKMFIFKDIKGFEKSKVVLENELYFIK